MILLLMMMIQRTDSNNLDNSPQQWGMQDCSINGEKQTFIHQKNGNREKIDLTLYSLV